MGVATKTAAFQTAADRIQAAVTQAVAAGGLSQVACDERSRIEPLESRTLFAAGDLDLTFAGTGTVTLDYFARNDVGRAVAVQSDDKVLLAGWVATGISSRGNDIAVARFNADGSLDTTFGDGGRVVTNLGSSTDSAYALSVQSDGRIVVAGTTRVTGSGNDFAVVRYNADGSLDTTFGTGGITRTDLGGLATDQLLDMTLTGDGGIIAVGSTVIAGNQQLAAARYTAGGQLDTSFGGGDGIVVHTFAAGAAQAKAVAVCADGSMIVAGSTTNFSTFASSFTAVRLFADGALDTSFGAAGWATVNMGGESASAGAIVVQDGGGIVLVGQRSLGDEQDVALARLTDGGQLEPTFGGSGTGYVVTDFAAGVDWATGALAQADGKIVVVGQGTVNGPYRMAVARYDADGLLDTTFGSNGTGKVLVSFNDAGESFGEGGVAIDSQGRLVVGGQVTRSGVLDMAVARLQNTVVVNDPPVAHAGGAYGVNAGGVISLDGSGSADADGAVVSYEWDFDYDGSSFDVDATGVAPTFSAAGLAGPLTRIVALRVTDGGGATSTVATAVVTINAAPTAAAGGSYVVNAGGSIVLDGGGSSDVDGSVASYAWDFDYDGSSFGVDATGAAPTFSAASLSGPAVRTVALRVTDDRGATSVVATAVVTINAAPTAQPGGAYSVIAGQALQLDGGSSSDPDGTIVSYAWDLNYDGATFDVDAVGAATTFTAPADGGGTTRTVALRCVDNHGAVSVTTTTITINPVPLPPQGPGTAMLVDDPSNPGKKMLYVVGTAGDDTIRLKQDRKGKVEVRLDNKRLGSFGGMTRIVIDGGAGSDTIDAGGVTVPVVVMGGTGNDVITGGSGNDILMGGAGKDRIDGRYGNDLIGGGAGRDVVTSHLGNDLVLGGSLSFENDLRSTTAVLAEWTRKDRSLSQRVSNLMNGGGKNGSTKLAGNLLDDHAVDRVLGTPNADWLLTGAGDRVVRVK